MPILDKPGSISSFPGAKEVLKIKEIKENSIIFENINNTINTTGVVEYWEIKELKYNEEYTFRAFPGYYYPGISLDIKVVFYKNTLWNRIIFDLF